MFETFRRPEYTGPNRCLPCTAVNAVLAIAAAAAVVGLATVAGAGLAVAGGAGAVVLVGAAASIYLRGYLVPGTPRLTKRYLPDRVLGWFDKRPEPGPTPAEFDIEGLLVGAGIVVDDPALDDVRLDPDFDADWWTAIRRFRENGDLDAALADFIDVPEDRVTVSVHRQGVDVTVDGGRVGRWESEPAARADMAAAGLLADRIDGWAAIEVQHRSSVLHGLRIFLERCPRCEADLDFTDREVRVGCCKLYDVDVLTCTDCGAAICELGIED